jgi:hypothetical protein
VLIAENRKEEKGLVYNISLPPKIKEMHMISEIGGERCILGAVAF